MSECVTILVKLLSFEKDAQHLKGCQLLIIPVDGWEQQGDIQGVGVSQGSEFASLVVGGKPGLRWAVVGLNEGQGLASQVDELLMVLDASGAHEDPLGDDVVLLEPGWDIAEDDLTSIRCRQWGCWRCRRNLSRACPSRSGRKPFWRRSRWRSPRSRTASRGWRSPCSFRFPRWQQRPI